MDGKEFIALIAEISFYSTLSRKKIKDVEIYNRLKISHSQFSHYKTHETARISSEVASELKAIHQEVLDYYNGLNDPIKRIDEVATHKEVSNQSHLEQRLNDLEAMLEAERSAKKANERMINLLEDKVLALLEKFHATQMQAIEELRREMKGEE